MERDLVSVIIPTFNRSNYLQIAIESVLNQTYPSVELIVVDDGSTDGTRELLQQKYSDRIIYLWQENQGESAARNKGLSIAKGKYVAFLDSDDFWEPFKLELQVQRIINEPFETVAGVFSSVWLVDEAGYKTSKRPFGRIKSKEDLSFENFLSKVPIYAAPSNLLLRASSIKCIGGFDTSIQYGEDQDFLLRLKSKFEFAYIDTPLVFYRIHGNNQSNIVTLKSLSKRFADRLSVIEKHVSLHNNIDQKVVIRINNRILATAASWCFYYEKYKDGIIYLKNIKKHGGRGEIPSKIAYVALLKFNKLNLPTDHAGEFINFFLANIEREWTDLSVRFPSNKIKGLFFKELIQERQCIRKYSISFLLLFMVKYIPRLMNLTLVKSLLKVKS